MSSFFKRGAFVALLLIQFSSFAPGSTWDDREDATGDWAGIRQLWEEEYGLHFDIDYTAESFSYEDGEDLSYRGNLDIVLTIDNEKLGLWRGGSLFFYGQNTHGSGVSDELGFLMPVSNLEAESFTQLSEFWLHQPVGDSLQLRLGKQDANRDFGNPRFSGNFMNSSFGVMPGIPMPSFPSPGLGAAVFLDVNDLLSVRGGLYEGTPVIGSFGESVFAEDAGIFLITGFALKHDVNSSGSGLHQVGIWTHTSLNRSGVFGVFDLLLATRQDGQNQLRSIQMFLRGGWSPEVDENPDEITNYIGGGFTAHGFLGHNNTIGVGTGRAHTQGADESFVELFFKLREIEWLTFEPDVQIYFRLERRYFIFGLRTKLKL